MAFFEFVEATATDFFFCAARAARTGVADAEVDNFFALFFADLTDPAFFAAGFTAGRFAAAAFDKVLAAAFLEGGLIAGFLPRESRAVFFADAGVDALRTPAFFAAIGFFVGDFAGDLPAVAALAHIGALLALARLAG